MGRTCVSLATRNAIPETCCCKSYRWTSYTYTRPIYRTAAYCFRTTQYSTRYSFFCVKLVAYLRLRASSDNIASHRLPHKHVCNVGRTDIRSS